VDALTLDGLIGEIRSLVIGRHVARVRAAEAQAVLLEVSGARDLRLWLDAGRAAGGLYALTRDQARAAQDESALAGRARQALLLFRKHLEGRRLVSLRRVPGARVVVLEAGESALALGLSASPALTLAVDGAAIAAVGDGPPGWPVGEAPEREWDVLDAGLIARALAEAAHTGGSPVRAVLEACPGLGPHLARAVAESGPHGFAALRESWRDPRPFLRAPAPLEGCDDAQLAGADALALLPAPVARAGRVLLPQPSWTAAAAAFLEAHLRGRRFEVRRRTLVEAAARDARRLERLLAHLEQDLAGLPAAGDLRRQAEALLAAGWPSDAPGAAEVEVEDPYDPRARLVVRVDPALGLPANADRLFDKARRIERARGRVEERIAATRSALQGARAREAAARAARGRAGLDALGAAAPAGGPPAGPASASRHYLTSRGLSILVGRGARENQRLTFAVARPEDLWLHARDVPGAHVIVRDPEGRASAEDVREAAELAAFFSGASRQAQVDVHVTRRKHVRPARGRPGRVTVGHSDTLRVAPRDPEGRLRRR
jgi:hypothetical protein